MKSVASVLAGRNQKGFAYFRLGVEKVYFVSFMRKTKMNNKRQ